MLYLKRDSRYADKLRNYKVILDGSEVNEIADGQELSMKLAPGKHTLRLGIDWAKSNEVSFDLKNGEDAHFKCASRVKGSAAFLAVFYVIFSPNKYIELEKLD